MVILQENPSITLQNQIIVFNHKDLTFILE